MLKGSLYKITLLNHGENTIDANIELNADSPIFSGHFPGQPVLPGACMLQIVKEVLEAELKKPLGLKIASQIKYLRMVDPRVDKEMCLKLTYMVEGSLIIITAVMNCGGEVCFKLKGTFV